jgi:acetylornithine deacetylase
MSQRTFARQALRRYRDEIVAVAQDLIRTPSRNTPPVGEESACQQYIAAYLRRAGLPADLYEPDQVPGLTTHPAYWPGRDYRDRPNVASTQIGRGGGRSLLLTGHVDTVVCVPAAWSAPPFAAEIRAGRLYGLGAVDMKGPLAAMLVLYKAVKELGLPLRGDLGFESVVDEEEGGVNSTIAGRLRDGPMDAAIIAETTDLKIYPAARGLLIPEFVFTSLKEDWLQVGTRTGPKADAIEQIGLALVHVKELVARRRTHPVHPLYAGYPDPRPVEVTKVYAGGWGSETPILVPSQGYIQLIVQALPGEERADVLREVEEWLESVMLRHPDAFATRPEIRFSIRWMAPTAMDPAHPLVTILSDSVAQTTGARPEIAGAPYACDMFALHQIFDMPAVIFGPRGGGAHAGDEYVELASLFTFWESLLLFVMSWCGMD